MPKVKLTLTIDDDLLNRVKIISKKKGKSLSSITESLYKAMSADSGNLSIAKKLYGCAYGELSGKTDEEIKALYLSERHG